MNIYIEKLNIKMNIYIEYKDDIYIEYHIYNKNV